MLGSTNALLTGTRDSEIFAASLNNRKRKVSDMMKASDWFTRIQETEPGSRDAGCDSPGDQSDAFFVDYARVLGILARGLFCVR